MPGTPTVVANRRASFAGTIDGSGSAAPDTHHVTLNAGAVLNKVVRRVDAVDLPAVPAPPAPTGSVDVVVDAPGDVPADFSAVRNLTLNRGAGTVALPGGTYGVLTVNAEAVVVLGVGARRNRPSTTCRAWC